MSTLTDVSQARLAQTLTSLRELDSAQPRSLIGSLYSIHIRKIGSPRNGACIAVQCSGRKTNKKVIKLYKSGEGQVNNGRYMKEVFNSFTNLRCSNYYT